MGVSKPTPDIFLLLFSIQEFPTDEVDLLISRIALNEQD